MISSVQKPWFVPVIFVGANSTVFVGANAAAVR
jgi:hypothetical protein